MQDKICLNLFNEIITFNKGLLGFEHLKKFRIIKIEENPVFDLLQSTEDENIGFVVISPFHVEKNYELDLKKVLIEDLKIEKEEDVLLLTTVTLNSDINKITTNLRAPIVINIKTLLGEQVIIEKEKYKIKTPLVRGD